jgi:hypothetical protein
MNTKCSTLGDIKKILSDLKKENNPLDAELIAFFENKIQVETDKALRKIDIKKILLKHEIFNKTR